MIRAHAGLDERLQQVADGADALQPESRPRRAGPHADGDRLGRKRGEQIFVGAIVTDRHDRRSGQPLGGELGDHAALVDAIGPDLEEPVAGQDLHRLIAEYLVEVKSQLVGSARAGLGVGHAIVPGDGRRLGLDERARRPRGDVAENRQNGLAPAPPGSAAGTHSLESGARDQNACSACSQTGRWPSQWSSASRARPLTTCTSVSGRAAAAPSR